MWDEGVVPMPEEELTPRSTDGGAGPAGQPAAARPRGLAAPAPAATGAAAVSRAVVPEPISRLGRDAADKTGCRRIGFVIARGLLGSLAAYPGLAALFALAVFGALAGVGLWRLPPRLERGFDLLAESDADSAILQGAFAASAAENARVGERRNGSAIDTYRIFDVFVTYALKDQGLEDGILNARALAEIADFERSLRALPAWQAMCAMAEEHDRPLCEPGLSVATYAFASRDVGRGEIVPRSLVLDGRGQDALPPAAALHVVRRHKLDDLLLPRAPGVGGSAPTTARSAFRFKLPCKDGAGQEALMAVKRLQADWDALVEESLLPALQASRADDDRRLLRVDFAGAGLRAAEYMELLLMDVALAAGAATFSFMYLVWHTRSFLLSVVAVGLSLLALPLAHSFLAMALGSLQVGAFFLVSAFCTMGVGVDAALVYTDLWWDSARREVTEIDRLARTYRLSGQITLAASVATALSFFAMLASVVRQVREFGLFTGISVLVAWLLVSLVYVPLCILGDRHCAACRLHTASSRVAAFRADGKKPDGPEQEEEEEGRVGSRAFAALLPRLRFFRCPACLLPVLLAVASCYIAFWQAKLSTASLEPLPEGHIARRGERVMQGFVEAPRAFGTGFALPALADEVCGEHLFRSDDERRCGLFWCEAAPLQPRLGGCACHRRERTGCGQAARATAVQRFVGLHPVFDVDLLAAAGAYMAADLAVAGLSRHSGAGPPGGAASAPLAPLVLQDFQSGQSTSEPLKQVTTPLVRQNSLNSSCGWEDLCFCDGRTCRLPGQTWQEVSRVFPQLPHLATSAPRQAQPPLQPVLVHIVFGLQVHRVLPLLGKRDWSSTWSFLESFDVRQPATQIDLRAICSAMPQELRVAERRCWTDDFESFLTARSERFPVPASRFDALFADFLRSGRTSAGSSDEHFWLRGGRLKACSVSFALDVPRTASEAEALHLKKQWDSYVQAFNGVASLYAHGAFHTSELWAEAEAERALRSSVGLVAGVAVVLAFVSTLIFTHSFLLPFFVTATAVGSMSCTVFFAVVVLGWAIGPVEVVVLVAFSGYSINGALHIACAYSSNEALMEALPQGPSGVYPDKLDAHSAARLRRTGYALKSLGGAVVGGGMATAVSSAFLALGQLTFCRKLGAVVPVLVLLSAFNALLPLPAGLLMCGPASLTQKRLASLTEVRERLRGLRRCCPRCCRSRHEAVTGGAPSSTQEQVDPCL